MLVAIFAAMFYGISGYDLAMDTQERIQDFFKEEVVTMRVQGKHPRAKGMG